MDHSDHKVHRCILLVHNVLWSHYKGPVFSELNQLFASLGIDSHFIHIALTERQRQSLSNVDRSVHKYPYEVLFDKCFEDIGVVRRCWVLALRIARSRPAVLIISGYSDLSYWVAALFARILNSRVIVTVDSTEKDKRRHWWTEAAKRVFFSLCDSAFCYGEASRRYVLTLGMRADRIVTGCHATDNDLISRAYSKWKTLRRQLAADLKLSSRNFIYVGRLAPEKNLHRLVDAFRTLRAACPESRNWGLMIVGDGPERITLERYVSSYKVPAVRFLGAVSWREVPKLFACADVLVIPSTSEPWGLVINEAMACGMPVIASANCGACDDLVRNGVNGIVFNPYSKEDLCSALQMFVSEEELIDRMGHASLEVIAMFTPQDAAKRMFQGIEDVLGRAR